MELVDLLAKAGSLPEPQQRKVAAILGSLVADAAAQPIHWVYNEDHLAKAVEGVDHPEFLPKSVNPFYCLPTGQQSPYGDELMVMLESLAACKGFDSKDSAKRMFEAFGPGSPYDNPLSAQYGKNMGDKSMYPVQGKWRNFLLRRFCNLHAEGKEVESMLDEDLNVDPDNIPRLVPLVALLAGDSSMLETAFDAASQLQKSDLMLTAVLSACRVMEQYIVGIDASSGVHPVEKVIEDLKRADRSFSLPLDRAMAGHLKDVFETRGLGVVETAKKFGKQ